jgi:oligoribonuclease NrnB/cAMP/cGMP phosphodiesterase (DHH superfamily)
MTVTDIVYHGGCSDGFTSAWLLHKAYPDATVTPGRYGEDPPEFGAAAHVVIADFSYKRDVFMAIAEHVTKVTILDHHKTAMEDLVDLPDNVEVVFDMERSGAMITLGWLEDTNFHNGVRPLVRYIQDRDLWTKELPFTDEIGSVIQASPFSYATWDKLAARVYETWYSVGDAGDTPVVAQGEAIYMNNEKIIETILNRARLVNIAGHIVLAVDSPYAFGSEVAGRLAAKGYNFGAYYLHHPWGTQWGLRSRGDFDVSEIAVKFGGGGHAPAAGFKMIGSWDVEDVKFVP